MAPHERRVGERRLSGRDRLSRWHRWQTANDPLRSLATSNSAPGSGRTRPEGPSWSYDRRPDHFKGCRVRKAQKRLSGQGSGRWAADQNVKSQPGECRGAIERHAYRAHPLRGRYSVRASQFRAFPVSRRESSTLVQLSDDPCSNGGTQVAARIDKTVFISYRLSDRWPAGLTEVVPQEAQHMRDAVDGSSPVGELRACPKSGHVASCRRTGLPQLASKRGTGCDRQDLRATPPT